VSWAYASSYLKPISVPQSLILQMPRFGMDVVLAHPPEFKLMPDIMEQAQEQAQSENPFHSQPHKLNGLVCPIGNRPAPINLPSRHWESFPETGK